MVHEIHEVYPFCFLFCRAGDWEERRTHLCAVGTQDRKRQDLADGSHRQQAKAIAGTTGFQELEVRVETLDLSVAQCSRLKLERGKPRLYPSSIEPRQGSRHSRSVPDFRYTCSLASPKVTVASIFFLPR